MPFFPPHPVTRAYGFNYYVSRYVHSEVDMLLLSCSLHARAPDKAPGDLLDDSLEPWARGHRIMVTVIGLWWMGTWRDQMHCNPVSNRSLD
jgi:hypothetical protein